MVIGIAIAIIMSSIALVMLFNVSEKIEMIISHEENENIEIGAPSVKSNGFYVFTQELNTDEEKIRVPVAVFSLTEIVVH